MKVDAVIAGRGGTGVLVDDLAVVVNDSIVASADGIVIGGTDNAAVIVVDRNERGSNVGKIDGLSAGARAIGENDVAVAIRCFPRRDSPNR